MMTRRLVALNASTPIKPHRLGPVETGTNLVEFAIILPVLLLLSLGAITLGQIGLARFALDAAAREAARTGAEVGAKDGGGQASAAEQRARQVADSLGIDGSAIIFQIESGGSLGRWPRGCTRSIQSQRRTGWSV